MKAFLQLVLIGFLSLLLGGAVQETTEIIVGSRKLPNLSMLYGAVIFAIIVIIRLILHYRKLGRED